MTKTSVKNLFEIAKYINILRMLDAYKAGLELRFLAYILVGEKTLLDTHYISAGTADYAKVYLKTHKNKEYELIDSKDMIKNIDRLIDCLNTLQKLNFVKKSKDGIYKINPVAKDILNVKEDVDLLNHYLEAFIVSGVGHNIIFDPDMSMSMSIYASCELVDAYDNYQEVREEVDGIKNEMKKLMTQLSVLSVKVHKAWREKIINDYTEALNEPESFFGKVTSNKEILAHAKKDAKDDIEFQKVIKDGIEEQKKWMDVNPIATVVMHSVPLHSKDFHFDPVKPLLSSDGKLLVAGAYQVI